MSDKNIYRKQGSGYQSKNGLIYMIRCFECGTKNYAMAVSSGYCAWCGYSPNEEAVVNNEPFEIVDDSKE